MGHFVSAKNVLWDYSPLSYALAGDAISLLILWLASAVGSTSLKGWILTPMQFVHSIKLQ